MKVTEVEEAEEKEKKCEEVGETEDEQEVEEGRKEVVGLMPAQQWRRQRMEGQKPRPQSQRPHHRHTFQRFLPLLDLPL